jgi:hypothetical protein
MVTLTTGIMSLLFSCMHFWVWRILQRWSACGTTVCEVVHDCRKFEKHCLKFYVTCVECLCGLRQTSIITRALPLLAHETVTALHTRC